MLGGRGLRIGLRLMTIAILAFIYAPIALIFVYSLNARDDDRLASRGPFVPMVSGRRSRTPACNRHS